MGLINQKASSVRPKTSEEPRLPDAREKTRPCVERAEAERLLHGEPPHLTVAPPRGLQEDLEAQLVGAGHGDLDLAAQQHVLLYVEQEVNFTAAIMHLS